MEAEFGVFDCFVNFVRLVASRLGYVSSLLLECCVYRWSAFTPNSLSLEEQIPIVLGEFPTFMINWHEESTCPATLMPAIRCQRRCRRSSCLVSRIKDHETILLHFSSPETSSFLFVAFSAPRTEAKAPMGSWRI